jgi:aspartate kinase
VKLTVTGVIDRPGVAAALFRGLADRLVNVDMIVQHTSQHGTTDISFTVPRPELAAALLVTEKLAPEIGAGEVHVDENVAQVSVVGAGMKTHPGVTAAMFETLAEAGINILMISTSPIRISCIVEADAADRAVQLLHGAFNLGDA